MSENRWAKANCRGRHDLPWTQDANPDPHTQAQMAQVCEKCPLIAQCALHALSEQPCGFYAGVWIPWPSTSLEYPANRREARSALRQAVVRTADLINA